VSRPHRPQASKDRNMALYVLMAIIIALVIYLFYAVIHPEKF
jgi:K+-transporting ATPase KdpF subunit